MKPDFLSNALLHVSKKLHRSTILNVFYRGNMDQRNLLIDIIRSEHSMTASTLNRDLDSCVSKICRIEEPNTYSVGSTGASVTADSSVNLVYKFCKKLPKDM